MFSGVPMKNVATCGDEQILRITKGVQTVDTDVSDEEGFGRSKGEDDSHALTMNDIPIPPPPVDNGKLGYVRRKKRSIRLCAAKSKALKKKVKERIGGAL
jgi:hypothetical protein